MMNLSEIDVRQKDFRIHLSFQNSQMLLNGYKEVLIKTVTCDLFFEIVKLSELMYVKNILSLFIHFKLLNDSKIVT